MSILNFTAAPPSAASNGRTPFSGLAQVGAAADRPKAKIWLNIGREVNGKFINLPIGLPVDTMEPADVRGQNMDWVKQKNAQNQLLDALKKLGMTMEPGEEQVVNLELRMRRVNEALEVESTDNEYSLDLGSLFVTPATAEAPQLETV